MTFGAPTERCNIPARRSGLDGKPKGYIQVWFAATNNTPANIADYPWLKLMPDNAVGIDLSIGSEDDCGHGLGSRVVKRFCRLLIERGFDQIYIDPDPENTRAINAYARAGFVPVEAFENALLMRFDKGQT